MNPANALSYVTILLGALALGQVFNNTLEHAKSTDDTSASSSIVEQQEQNLRYDYDLYREKITYGQATLAEARRAMTDRDPVSLTNTIHALYTMRHHRGVIYLLDGMWRMDAKKYPEISWDLVAKAPVRIALASTINRIKIIRTEAFQSYIRKFSDDDHEFIRAQVVVALGFNGDPVDLPYLKSMADGNNHYVAQSAITGLSIFGGPQARNVLIELEAKHRGTSRGDLMGEMLRRVYDWKPGVD